MQNILVVHGWANMIRARAAVFLVAENFERFDCIIFSWGRTSWPMNPSEAESMRDIFLNKMILSFPLLDALKLQKKILLEQESYDTESNAQKVLLLVGSPLKKTFTLLSSFSHLPRIKSIYSRLGFTHVTTLSAEGLFFGTNIVKHQDFIFRYIISYHVIRSAIIEVPLYFLTQFVFWRRWIHSKTKTRISDI